jgi:hypothetical protein
MRPLSTVLLACSGLGCLTPVSLVAQARPLADVRADTHVVSGLVTDSSKTPVPGAEVRLVVGGVQAGAAYTGSDGRYSLSAGAAPGPTLMTVRRLGFEPREIPLEAVRQAADTVNVVLRAAPHAVPAVNVVDDPSESNPRIAAFKQRRALGRGGYFLDHAEIHKKRAQRLSDVIRAVPGVSIVASGRTGNAVRFRNCQPMVWVDGVRMPDAELDETVAPSDVAGIEIYVSPAGVPAQFRDLQNPCGAVVVWTR